MDSTSEFAHNVQKKKGMAQARKSLPQLIGESPGIIDEDGTPLDAEALAGVLGRSATLAALRMHQCMREAGSVSEDVVNAVLVESCRQHPRDDAEGGWLNKGLVSLCIRAGSRACTQPAVRAVVRQSSQ